MTASFIGRSLFAACVVAGLGACTATLTVKPQTKFVPSQPVSKTTSGTFTTQKIDIQNQNGDITVTGSATATNVTVSIVPFAFGETQAEGDAAVEDVTSTFTVTETADAITIRCGQAKAAHGKAAIATTGCERMTITVPSGTAAQPLSLAMISGNGSVTARGLVGGISVKTKNGSVDASFDPTVGSDCAATSENGSVKLSLPASFAADSVRFYASTGQVTVSGITDLLPSSTSRGTPGSGAKSITAGTDNGSLTVSGR